MPAASRGAARVGRSSDLRGSQDQQIDAFLSHVGRMLASEGKGTKLCTASHTLVE